MAPDTRKDPRYGIGALSICPFCGLYSALRFEGGFFSCRAFMWCGEAGKIETPEQRKTYEEGVVRGRLLK